MDTLYNRIQELCKSKGIKGGKMCVDLGLSKSLMTKLKSDASKTINADTAQKIASYFNVSVGYLLGESPTTEVSSSFSAEELALIEWYRNRATEKDKAIVRVIMEREK